MKKYDFSCFLPEAGRISAECQKPEGIWLAERSAGRIRLRIQHSVLMRGKGLCIS